MRRGDDVPELSAALRFRTAAPLDYGAVNQLCAEVHALHSSARPDVFASTQTPMDGRAFQRLLDDPQSAVYIVEASDQIVGYAVLNYTTAQRLPTLQQRKLCLVEDFCVARTQRRRGVGRAFFSFLVTKARERGAGSLELTVWEFNEGARRFYDEMGMKCRARRMEYHL